MKIEIIADDVVQEISKLVHIPSGEGIRIKIYEIILKGLNKVQK